MERPILFSTPMIQAILENRKTQTRRSIKNKDVINRFDIDVDGKPIAYIDRATGGSYPPAAVAPYQPGDTLWVRETWQDMSDDEGNYVYLADGNEGLKKAGLGVLSIKDVKWRPSIHMPREAARLFLTVKNVRVERLQNMQKSNSKSFGIAIINGLRHGWQTLGYGL